MSSDFDGRAPDCRHSWIANSGRGGAPEFRPAAIVSGDTPVMHVLCEHCLCRTWFTEEKWHALPVAGETRQQRRQRLREAAVIGRKNQEAMARELQRRQAEFERTGQTWWNGEPAKARRVIVRVGHSKIATWWCADLEGQERKAVEVTYGNEVFFLDDANGSGWAKVTVGRGSPGYGHSSLPDDSVVVREIGVSR